MPELPEVETVKRTLLKQIKDKKILSVNLRMNKLIETDLDQFINLKNETIKDIKRLGKWLIFELDNYYLLSHLRMEGKYFIKEKDPVLSVHDLCVFNLSDDKTLIYNDTRRFGKFALVKKDELYSYPKIKKLGYEYDDERLDKHYLFNKYKKTKRHIKTVLLDQGIFTGLGNIYANEVLFLSKISPLTYACDLSLEDCENIIKYSRIILKDATDAMGTTIRSYTSSLGVEGTYQSKLNVHMKENEPCKVCGEIIKMQMINGRSSYYCPRCQK